MDSWHGMTMEQIREIEAQTQKELDEVIGLFLIPWPAQESWTVKSFANKKF